MNLYRHFERHGYRKDVLPAIEAAFPNLSTGSEHKDLL
jgi:hypothetical protein